LKAVDAVTPPAVRECAFGVWLSANESRKKILSCHSRRIEFLFAPDRTRQTKLSYFFGSIDFARCDAEIDYLATIDRSRKVTLAPRKKA
jgi:hypothetical protein